MSNPSMLKLSNGETFEADLMVDAIAGLADANVELSNRLDLMEKDVVKRRTPSAPPIDADAEVARILAQYGHRR